MDYPLRGVLDGRTAVISRSLAAQHRHPPSSGLADVPFAPPGQTGHSRELLGGPMTGVVSLPRHLKWSGNPHYDLGEPGRVADLYRAVINEAAVPTDLHTYLERDTLLRLWPTMWLPIAIRNEWEAQFPELAELRTSAA